VPSELMGSFSARGLALAGVLPVQTYSLPNRAMLPAHVVVQQRFIQLELWQPWCSKVSSPTRCDAGFVQTHQSVEIGYHSEAEQRFLLVGHSVASAARSLCFRQPLSRPCAAIAELRRQALLLIR
jgi:hypothetical protein